MKMPSLYIAGVCVALVVTFFGCFGRRNIDFEAADRHENPTVALALEKRRVFIAVPPFDLAGGKPNGGKYEGRGVSNGRFSPEEAGVGLHEIVYTYEGVSASDSIEVIGARQRHADPSCSFCNGTGLLDCMPRVECGNCVRGRVCVGMCMVCNGSGRIKTAWKLWLGTRDCPDCQGTGRVFEQCKRCKGLATVKCPDCKGTGKATCKCLR